MSSTPKPHIDICTVPPLGPLVFDVHEDQKSYGIEVSFWHHHKLIALGIASDPLRVPEVIEDLKTSRGLWKNAHLHHSPTPAPKVTSIELWGTPFQCHVLKTLMNFEGPSLTYQQLATLAGHPQAARAVGTVLAGNPVSRYIPCHKVVQKGGRVGSYRWGASLKKTLLDHEHARTLEDARASSKSPLKS